MMQSCASAAKLRGGGPILETGVSAPWPASGDRHLGSSSDTDHVLFVRLRKLVLLSAYLTPPAIQRQSEPRQWSPGAIEQLAICAPALRSLFCVFCRRSRFVPDTTGLMRCLSGGAKSAKLTGSCRGVLGRCPPSRVLSLAACCRSRLALSETSIARHSPSIA